MNARNAPQAPRRPRGRPMSEEAGDAIFTATVALLGEVGVDGFTLRDVVQRAGVGLATIYRRWPSKSDLVADTITRLMARNAPPPIAGSPTETIRAVTHRLVHVLTETPVGAALPTIVAEAARNPTVAAIFRGWLAERRQVLSDALREGVATGEFRADLDVDAAFDMLAGPPYYRKYFLGQELTPEYATRHAEEFIRGVRDR